MCHTHEKRQRRRACSARYPLLRMSSEKVCGTCLAISSGRYGYCGQLLATQGEFLHFTGGGLGEALDKLNRLGGLEVRHAVATEGDQLLLTGVLLRFEHDDGLGHFPPPGVWHTDHGGFEHCRVLVEHGLYFHR